MTPNSRTAAPATLTGPRARESADEGGDTGTDRPLDFDELVLTTGAGFHRAALLLTGGDHHLAEDLLQTTYTQVYSRWARVSRADDPVAYTRTVLTNTFLSHRRLRRSHERPTDDLPDAAVAPEDPSTRIDLLATLGRLRPRDRAVVVSRYWFDRSVADVAADLGMTSTAVRTASRRALTRMRLDLADPDLPGTDAHDTDPTGDPR